MNQSKNEYEDTSTPLATIDGIQLQIRCAIEALYCIHEVMEHNESCADNYSSAVYGVCCYLNYLNNNTRNQIDALFKKGRKVD